MVRWLPTILVLAPLFGCSSQTPPPAPPPSDAPMPAAAAVVEPTPEPAATPTVEPPTEPAPPPAVEQPPVAANSFPRIAGKDLDYVPYPGSPSIVTVFPASGSELAPDQPISVVWDQPVTVAQVRRAIYLRGDDIPQKDQGPFEGGREKHLQMKLQNATSGELAGHTLDPKQIIEVRMVHQRGPGKGLEISFTDESLRGGPQYYYYKVARKK